jgi:hypothetical protein
MKQKIIQNNFIIGNLSRNSNLKVIPSDALEMQVSYNGLIIRGPASTQQRKAFFCAVRLPFNGMSPEATDERISNVH